MLLHKLLAASPSFPPISSSLILDVYYSYYTHERCGCFNHADTEAEACVAAERLCSEILFSSIVSLFTSLYFFYCLFRFLVGDITD